MSRFNFDPIIFTLAQIQDMAEEMSGACIKCGAVRECCEPDARKYHCDECGQNQVYGAEEILLMDLVSG
ncbi:MAG: hypothetical protein ACRD34_00020 [Bryobacteraceae bacterium]